MPESRFLKIIIICLLLLNAGTLGYLFLQDRRPTHFPPGRDGGGRQGTAAYLYHELNLTDAQEQRYKTMRDRHHSAVMDLREKMRQHQKALYGLLQSYDTATPVIPGAAAAIDSIAAGQREIERITFDHFREFRAICTPAQQKKFDAVISEALERMH